jgi:hypothetical protein
MNDDDDDDDDDEQLLAEHRYKPLRTSRWSVN